MHRNTGSHWSPRQGPASRSSSSNGWDSESWGHQQGNHSQQGGQIQGQGCGRRRKRAAPRHPPELRGRDIGLWYAAKSKKGSQKEKNKELKNRPVIAMGHEAELKVARLLDSFQQQADIDKPGCSTSLNDECDQDWNCPTAFQLRYQNHLAQSSVDYQRNNTFDPELHGLVKQEHLDQRYADELKAKWDDFNYQMMLAFRERLPAYQMRHEIVDTIERNQVVVISGETGCGKTTQVPQFLLDSCIAAGKGSICSIVCTQPRRISAISIAERVAEERAENCGLGSVGYQIRLESKMPREYGSILYCTTGIMLKWLESDQFLAKKTHIILDEVHERDVLSDFLLIILKDLLVQRPDLKLILMSASLNAQQFSKYYGNCPMLKIPGFTFPVKELFLEDVLEETQYFITAPDDQGKKGKFSRWRRGQHLKIQKSQFEMGPFIRNLADSYSSRVIESLKNLDEETIDLDLTVALIRHVCTHKPDGAILVFLPGWDQISKVHNMLNDQGYFRSGKYAIFPLHSMMPTVTQKEVFCRSPPGIRKIILATNIAETSITIDDVVYVIDCGKIKIKNFDVEKNLATLKPEWVSRANALQRKGRAGRVQPGVCYHLYTSYRHELLDSYQLPEMLRTRLEELCLQIKLLKLGKIIPLLERAMEPPQIEAVKLSVEFLQTLNALDADENLTPLGFHLAHLPVDPQTGKMILFGAIFSCLDPIASVAASLGFKDAFIIPLGKEREADNCRLHLSAGSTSDHILLVNALKGWEDAKRSGKERLYCRDNFLASHTLQLLANMKQQLVMYLQDLNFVTVSSSKDPALNRNSKNMKLVKAVVCAGLYPNVAKVKTPKIRKPHRMTVSVATKQDPKVTIHPKSVNAHLGNFESPWLIYHQKMKSSDVFLYDCTVIPPYPLLFFGGNLKVEDESDQTAIVVDDWIRFWCKRSMAKLFMNLRRELDSLLEKKITNPGPTDWNKESNEGALLQAIVELLASEEILTNEVLRESEHLEKEYDEENEDGIVEME